MSLLKIIIRYEAEIDITDAAIFYQQQQHGLGDELLREIDASVTIAAENPYRFPRLRRRPDVRRVLVNRFPYRIFFVRRDDAIVVFRVLHAARHDREWKSQVPES